MGTRKAKTGDAVQADGTQPAAKKERKKGPPAIDRAMKLLGKMPSEDVKALRKACDEKMASALAAAEAEVEKLRGA